MSLAGSGSGPRATTMPGPEFRNPSGLGHLLDGGASGFWPHLIRPQHPEPLCRQPCPCDHQRSDRPCPLPHWPAPPGNPESSWGGREPRAQSALAPGSPSRVKDPTEPAALPHAPQLQVWPPFLGSLPSPSCSCSLRGQGWCPPSAQEAAWGQQRPGGLRDNSPRLTSLPPQGTHPLGGKKDDSVGDPGEWGAWLWVGPAPPSPTQAPPLLGHRGHNKLPGDDASYLPQLQSECPHLA